MKIRKALRKDKENCLKIANSLSGWFNEATLKEMRNKILDYPTFIYEEDGKIKGFITLKEQNKDIIDIIWIAVEKDFHRNGIGTELLKYTERELKGRKIIKVKTLDGSEKYKPYEQTRAFYEKNGFLKIETVDPYPGWEPGNPCAIYIKPIG